MAFDDDETDDEVLPSTPLPLDDRLWRHPSELARLPRAATPPPPAGPAGPGRSLVAVALAGACLAGAVVAFGAMWVTRPTRVVVDQVAAPTTTATTPVSAARFTPAGTASDELATRTAPSLATVHIERSGEWSKATAIWLDDDGGIVVAAPSIAGADALVVVGDDGRRQAAEIVAIDPATAIAVLDVASTTGSPMTSSSTDARSGALVAVIGAAAPTGDGQPGSRFVSAAVSAIGVRTALDDLVLHDALELDRSLPDDATGGAVVDQSGDLVAIVVAAGSGGELAVAVPAAAAMDAARALRTHGEVRRGWLGVQATDLGPGVARFLDLRGGAVLTAVQPDSPAARGGLQAGDVVVRVEDRRIDDASDLVMALRASSPEATVEIVWVRGGREEAAPITLGDGGGG